VNPTMHFTFKLIVMLHGNRMMHVLALCTPEFLTIYLFISGQLIIGADAQDIYQHLSHYGEQEKWRVCSLHLLRILCHIQSVEGKWFTFLPNEGQRPSEDIHEVRQPVRMRGTVKLSNVHDIILIFQHSSCIRKRGTKRRESIKREYGKMIQ